jgi:hypothetical protein
MYVDKNKLLIGLSFVILVIIYAIVKTYSNNNPYVTLAFFGIIGFSSAIYGAKKFNKDRTVKNKIGGVLMIILSSASIYFSLFSEIDNHLIYSLICVLLIIPLFFAFSSVVKQK